MRKAFLTALAAALFLAESPAQKPARMTIQDCLRRAVAASAQVKKANFDRAAVRNRVKEQRAQGYPQVWFNAGAEGWFEQPPAFLPGELFSKDGYESTTLAQPFQLSGEVRLDQKIIAPGVFASGKMKDAGLAVAALMVEKTEEEVLFQVAQHFYQTAQNQSALTALQANIDKLDALSRMAEIQFKNDLATRTDVKRLQVARTNLETQRQGLELGIEYQLGLLQLMTGLSPDQPIELATDALVAPTDSALWSGELAPMLGTTEIRLLFKSLEINKLRAKIARSENGPSLDAWARVGYLTGRTDPYFFKPSGRWLPMAGAGLRLRYPLFDGFGQKNRVQQLDLESHKTEEDVRQLENFKALEFGFAKKQMRNSLRLLDAQRGNSALAIEVYGKVLQQYKEGLVSLNDVLGAQTAVSEAESALNREIFNYKLAELRFLKSVGRLRELLK